LTVGRSMFEVILGLTLFAVLAFQAYSAWLIGHIRYDSKVFEGLDGTLFNIEGKLQLTLEKIETAMDEIAPPTVAEHVAGMASLWMQQRMMDKMGNIQHLNEPAAPHAEAWHAEEPLKEAEAEQ